MSKHMRLVVSILFIVIIILAVGITRFYSDTGKKAGTGKVKYDIARKLDGDGQGNRIFEDSSGLYGVIDTNENVIVPAEWLELKFAGNGFCIASKRLGGRLLMGCVDYDGNITVPFIFRNIMRRDFGGFSFYTAESDRDNTCVVYDESFVPCFSRSWNSCSLSGNEMTLTSSRGTYTYSISDEGFNFKSALIHCEALGCGCELAIYSQMLLAKLDIPMLEEIASSAAHYIEFAYTGNGDYVSSVRTGGRPIFTTLFPEDKRVLSKKLMGIRSLSLNSARSVDGVPHYKLVAVCDTEVTYAVTPAEEVNKDETPKADSLRGDFKAVIEFSGSSMNDLRAVSGKFTETSPDYPKPEPPEMPTDEYSASEGAGDTVLDVTLISE